MKKKVALYGGSFNPIHIGHLALANFICEEGIVDELWFVLSPENPLKKETNLLDENQRFEMVQLAIQGYPKFKASNFEFHLPRPSYTINTLHALNDKFPDTDFYVIIGADNWSLFDKWKSADEIIDNYHLLIYPRSGYPINSSTLPQTVQYLDSPEIEVSSTFIRNSIKEGKNYCYFMHPAVCSYIQKNKLYR